MDASFLGTWREGGTVFTGGKFYEEFERYVETKAL
jgi:hypothetical protein